MTNVAFSLALIQTAAVTNLLFGSIAALMLLGQVIFLTNNGDRYWRFK